MTPPDPTARAREMRQSIRDLVTLNRVSDVLELEGRLSAFVTAIRDEALAEGRERRDMNTAQLVEYNKAIFDNGASHGAVLAAVHMRETAEEAVRSCPSLDTNGHIAEKQHAINAIRALPLPTPCPLTLRDVLTPEQAEAVRRRLRLFLPVDPKRDTRDDERIRGVLAMLTESGGGAG